MNKSDFSFFDRDLKQNKRAEYRFAPCDALSAFIKEFIVIECENGMELEILPSTSIAIDYIVRGNISITGKDGVKMDLPKAVAYGIAKTARQFTFSKNTVLLLVIFKEASAATVLKGPVNAMAEQIVPLESMFNAKKINQLGQQLKEADSHKDMVDIMEAFLKTALNPLLMDDLIMKAIHLINHRNGLISIKSLADELNVSRDVFEKRFRKKVGTTPKQYANLTRFRNVLRASTPSKNLTEIALNAGYYDQSHFIREFKSFAGKPPSDFR